MYNNNDIMPKFAARTGESQTTSSFCIAIHPITVTPEYIYHVYVIVIVSNSRIRYL